VLHVPIRRIRKYSVSILIVSVGVLVTAIYTIVEHAQAKSMTAFLQHITDPAFLIEHIIILVLNVPAFMIVAYLYQKQRNLAEKLNNALNKSQTREMRHRLICFASVAIEYTKPKSGS